MWHQCQEREKITFFYGSPHLIWRDGVGNKVSVDLHRGVQWHLRKEVSVSGVP
jgi:hypothetical protein